MIPEEIGTVLTTIASRFDAELLAMSESELEQRWFFWWEEKESIEGNTYVFSAVLELYKQSCRRWEEHHNGIYCLGERVRDKYLMRRVREFLAELDRQNAKLKALTASLAP